MFDEVWNKVFFQNRVLNYFIFLSVLLIGAIMVKVIKRVLLKKLYKWAEKTPNTMDDFLVLTFEEKVLPFLFYGVLYIALQFLKVSPVITKGVNLLGIILLTFGGVRFSLDILRYFLENYWLKKEKNVAKKHVLDGVLTFIRIMVWGFAFILLLDNLGVKISALVTGLGIGGVAVALAAQAILGDLFNYITIYFDRPFELGDFIIVGEYMGTVENIGVKTTRLRSLGGEQLILSNTDLTSSRLRNYKRMERRRVVFKIGVTYQTGLEDLKLIPELITDIINNIEDTTLDRAHFATFGDSSLVFEVVYYVNSSDYTRYMNIQQAINLKIIKEFTKRGIEFAYPTQTLYLNRVSTDIEPAVELFQNEENPSTSN